MSHWRCFILSVRWKKCSSDLCEILKRVWHTFTSELIRLVKLSPKKDWKELHPSPIQSDFKLISNIFNHVKSISLGCDFRFGGIFWIKVQFNFIKALLGHLRGGLIRQIQYLPLPDKLMNLCIHLLWLFYLKLVKFTSNMIDQINELNAKNRTTLTSAVVEKHGVTWFVKTMEAPRYFINKTKNISVTL